jgi:hypothetical protein
MSQVRFLADEDVRFKLVQAIRRLEPALEINTVQELGLSGSSDFDLLEWAYLQGYIILSHDVNTLKGHAEQRVQDAEGIAGVFLVKQQHVTRQVAESVVLIWSASELEEWRDKIVYLPLK